jgi:hypothetical protein
VEVVWVKRRRSRQDAADILEAAFAQRLRAKSHDIIF